MCTNSELLDNLEWYMDDLMQCFKGFIQKTIFVFTVVAGALIASVFYILNRMYCKRIHIACATAETIGLCPQKTTSCSSLKTCKAISPSSSCTRVCSASVLCDNYIPVCPKRSNPSCSRKKSCLKQNKMCSSKKGCLPEPCSHKPCSHKPCSRKTSCSNLPSPACSRSASSVCLRKRSCGNVGIRTCPNNSALKRICGPTPCTLPCPPSPCQGICSKLGKRTISSLFTCDPPKCYDTPKKPCNTPKRCPSVTRCKMVRQSSCCSQCCDE